MYVRVKVYPRCNSPYHGSRVTILAVRCDKIPECEDDQDEKDCSAEEDILSQVIDKSMGRLLFFPCNNKKNKNPNQNLSEGGVLEV